MTLKSIISDPSYVIIREYKLNVKEWLRNVLSDTMALQRMKSANTGWCCGLRKGCVGDSGIVTDAGRAEKTGR
jgi:hypothetical protein